MELRNSFVGNCKAQSATWGTAAAAWEASLNIDDGRHLTPCLTLWPFISTILLTRATDDPFLHGLRTPGKEIAFTARPKIKSQSQIYSCGRSIFFLPHRPRFSGFFELCLHWVSVVRAFLFPLISSEQSIAVLEWNVLTD